MNHGKMKRKHGPFKEDICVFPNHVADLMRDIKPLFGNKLVVFGDYI
jgi:hypothetical protein